MDLKKLLFFLVFFNVLVCCSDVLNEPDCSAVSCIGRPVIGLEILDDAGNIFKNGTYGLEDINIEGSTGEELTVMLKSGFDGVDEAILVIQNPDWTEGIYNYTLGIGDIQSVGLTAEFGNTDTGGCCGVVTQIENLEIDGNPVEMKNGFFTLILD